MPPPNAQKGVASPELYVDHLKARRAFWARRAQKAHPSKLAHVNTLLDPSQTQTELGVYTPSQAKDGPSPTLAEPYQAWHGLALEKNGHLKLGLGPFELDRDSYV